MSDSKITYDTNGKQTTFYLADGSTYISRSIKNPDVLKQILELSQSLTSYERSVVLTQMVSEYE